MAKKLLYIISQDSNLILNVAVTEAYTILGVRINDSQLAKMKKSIPDMPLP